MVERWSEAWRAGASEQGVEPESLLDAKAGDRRTGLWLPTGEPFWGWGSACLGRTGGGQRQQSGQHAWARAPGEGQWGPESCQDAASLQNREQGRAGLGAGAWQGLLAGMSVSASACAPPARLPLPPVLPPHPVPSSPTTPLLCPSHPRPRWHTEGL